MILGFHTISLLLHDEFTTSTAVAAMGYQCVAIRPRLGGFNPSDEKFVQNVLRFGKHARDAGLSIVFDTEGEFLHDPRVSRKPALASDDSEQAALAESSIRRWIDIAGDCGCDLITFSSGSKQRELTEESNLDRLSARIEPLISAAGEQIKLALRPAARDVIATVAQFERLKQWLGGGKPLWVAADVGEMLVGGEFPVGDRLARNLDDLACVYLSEPGIKRAHDRRVGHGDVDLSRVVRSLERHGYRGPGIVRVQGHSEAGLDIALEALEFLRKPKR